MVIVSVADLTVGTKNMSALGHYQTFRIAIAMSALPPKADIRRWCRHVAYYSGKGRSLSDDKPATTFNAIDP
jgi:hypothetical protein